MMFNSIVFIVVILFSFYLPGRFLLKITGYKLEDVFVKTSLALTVGITFFLLLLYIFSWVKIPFVTTLIAFLLSLLELRIILLGWKKSNITPKIFYFENIFLLIGSIAMTSVMWRSGLSTDNGLTFYSVNAIDGFYHLSLIGSLMHSFPPMHPGLADIPLRGYHFFYDLVIAHFATLYHFNKIDLFFRFFPFFIALFYGISGLAVARFLHFSQLTTRLFLFLLYFAQGFTFFLGYFFTGSYDKKIIQSIAHSPDPNVIFSLAILFSLFVLLFSSRTIVQFIVTGLLMGVVPNIKIYTGVILFGALFFVGIAAFMQKRDFRFLITLLVGGITAAFVYLPINFGAGQLIFAPFLLYKHFMESSSMFADFQWGLKYQIYESHNNYPRIAYLYTIAVLLFFIPSLGVRLVTLFYIPKLFHKQFYTLPNIFWITAIAITIIIPTFFIQSVAVFVIVQFLWFGYVLLLLPTAFSLGTLLKNAPVVVLIFVCSILVLLSIPDTYNTVKTYAEDPYIVTSDKVRLAQAIEKNIPPTSSILVLNRIKRADGFSDMYVIPLISGLTNRPVYYEPEVLEFRAVESTIRTRREVIDTIQEITYTTCDTSSIGKKQIRDIVLQTKSEYIVALEKNTCLDTLGVFKKIAEEGETALYKVL